VPDLHVETAVSCRARTSTTTTRGTRGLVHQDDPADVARALLTHTVQACIDDPTITAIDHHRHHPHECSPRIDRPACLITARRGGKPPGRRPLLLTASRKHRHLTSKGAS
jgi:hypothetical protein